MSERRWPHNGRDRDGRYRVRMDDVDELLADPAGEDHLRDDVRLGGAVADTGAHAGESGEHVERVIEENRDEVNRRVGRDQPKSRKRKR